MDLGGKRAVVIGLGVSGRAAARLLSARGARVLASDSGRPEGAGAELDDLRGAGVEVETGGHRPGLTESADLVVLSPGVDPSAGPAAEALAAGRKVVSEVEAASWSFDGRIVGITGSNGKSTTTSLCAAMLQRAGVRAAAGGNLGRAFSDLVLEEPDIEVMVLELSSFQLERVEDFRAHTGVLLNVTPDHLDRYPDMAAYSAAKARLWEGQEEEDWALFGADDPGAVRVSAPAPGFRIPVSRLSGPQRPGVWVERRGGGEAAVAALPGMEERVLFSLSSVPLPGEHNAANAMSAAAAAARYGAGREQIEEALRGFKALSHRLERVGEREGVVFYNDSKATNTDAARAALTGFDEGVVLIAGGKHKGSSYAPLARELARCGKAAVLIGEARPHLLAELEGSVPLHEADSLEEAVGRAWELARPEGVVLMAPACSSFDMFDDYKHRGRVFTGAVRRITESGGEG
ncbi:MAG: UDP-N-acetylmuramoyl-L-alanine--D-glutamate ligase [bacterium]